MNKNNKKVALVTGAYRGLGLGTCRELAERDYVVLLTSRDEQKGKKAAEELKNRGETHFLPLDVASDESVSKLKQQVKERFGKLDVLVNNAGVYLESGEEANSSLKADFEVIRRSFEVNTLGALRMCQAFLPLMKIENYGRVVNVSSGMGQLSEMLGGHISYRMSKTAMNTVTRALAYEFKNTGILINSVCPGWVRTEMGGPSATRSLEEGVYGIVWAATLPDDGPTGGFFRDGKPLAW